MQELFTSRQVEAALMVPRATLADLAPRLPVTRSPGAGRTRLFTRKDVIVLAVAVRLNGRGLQLAASLDAATAAEKHLESIIVDDADGTTWRLVADLEPDSMGRFRFTATASGEEAMDFLLAAKQAIVINLTEIVWHTLAAALAVKKAKGRA